MGLREELLAQGCVEMATEGSRYKTIYYKNLNEGIVAKVCRDCGYLKLTGEFYKEKRGLGGFRGKCKNCEKPRRLKYCEVNKDMIAQKSRDYRSKNKEKVVESQRMYREENRDVIRERCRRYYTENRDHKLKYNKVYYEKNKDILLPKKREYTKLNSHKIREYRRKYNSDNKERIMKYRQEYYQLNKEVILNKYEEWRKNNLDKKVVAQQRREARKRRMLDDLTIEQHTYILNLFENKCAISGDSGDIHLDHIIPLSTGREGTTFTNMIPLRSDLNISKKDKNIFEWFNANRDRFNLEQARFDALIEYLADINDMTVDEYRRFVYWCHENPREINELEDDNHVG